MELKTVKIVSPVTDENPLGYIVINETDLSKEHELFDEEGAKKADLQALLDEANKV